jgi:competence protein ComEA
MRPSTQAWWNFVLAGVAALAVVVLALRDQGDYGLEIERREAVAGIDELRVDVAGAVVQPGVVAVAPGERVADALARAGGPSADADTTAINLSRRLVDEDHIVVPRLGERAALLDLNRATVKELEALPGIGPAYAAAVLAARERSGPFASTDDLVTRLVLPMRVYEQIRDLVAVR